MRFKNKNGRSFMDAAFHATQNPFDNIGGFYTSHRHNFGRGGRGGGFNTLISDKIKGKLISSNEMHLVVLLILKTNGKSHGYEIIKAVEELTKGQYAPSPGMIYPLLSYIVELDQAICEPNGNRKSFTITKIGEQYLDDNSLALEQIIERVKSFGERMAAMKSHYEEEGSTEERWGRSENGSQDFEMRREFHNIKHKLREAILSKRTASNEEKIRVLAILRNAIEQITKTNEVNNK